MPKPIYLFLFLLYQVHCMFGATQLCTNYYKNLENKLGKVSEKQSGTGYDIIKCYPRVVNKTHI
jgi:hypothetical protein